MVKPFMFQNFWYKYKGFKDLVHRYWKVDFECSPFLIFHAKIRKVKRTLVEWSRKEYGNIFVRIATSEDIIKVKEVQLEIMPSPENKADLGITEAELSIFMKLEEEFWQQKAGMKWFEQGDKTLSFFFLMFKVGGKSYTLVKLSLIRGMC